MALIYQVDSVDYAFEKTLPPNLVIDATGTTNTGGWSNFALSMHVYVQPPADGVQEYSFVGTPPSGGATDALEPGKRATARIEAIDVDNYWGPRQPLAGIRVISDTNKKEVLFR